MKNYFEFEIDSRTAKAYKTLANIYAIEAIGLNLAQIFLDIASGKILSLTDAGKILDSAIKADIQDLKERAKFVNDFLDAKRFKACDEISAFVLNILSTPQEEVVGEESEKK